MKDLWFGLLLLALGLGMFVWAQRDFAGLVRWTGRLSKWGGLLPSTRLGLTLVSLFSILAGFTVLTNISKTSAAGNAISIVLVLLLLGGFLHDFLFWLWQRVHRGSEP